MTNERLWYIKKKVSMAKIEEMDRHLLDITLKGRNGTHILTGEEVFELMKIKSFICSLLHRPSDFVK